MIVVLDSSVIWRLVSPRASVENERCRAWAAAAAERGAQLMIPEIADYEVRRETLRSGNAQALRALDRLIEDLRYVALTTTAMRLAAQFWAQTRRDGYRTADDAALDVDVILAAQAVVVASTGEPTVIATENRRHLGRLAPAQHWDEVSRS